MLSLFRYSIQLLWGVNPYILPISISEVIILTLPENIHGVYLLATGEAW